jgi:hypothetical protein
MSPASKKNFRTVTVNDKLQRGYTYVLTEHPGRNFTSGFCPDLTPRQMLALGVFGGVYMRDCAQEFPPSWFAKAKFASGRKADPKLNFFGVEASQSLLVWKRKKWLHPDDPRGWFQWYCRYYMGRRHEDDARQIKRWKAFKRHVIQLRDHCARGDFSCRPRQRQALLHWAYDSRKY